MELYARVKKFAEDENGAVTVDWVVLTAAIVGLGMAVMLAVTPGMEQVTNDIDAQLSSTTIVTVFE